MALYVNKMLRAAQLAAARDAARRELIAHPDQSHNTIAMHLAVGTYLVKQECKRLQHLYHAPCPHTAKGATRRVPPEGVTTEPRTW